MIATTIASLLFAAAAAAPDGEPEPGAPRVELVKMIEINGDTLSEIYPAVWLNPEQGTLHKLVAKSEDPPVEGASIWIEPRDPEFSFGPGIEGMKMVVAGFGEDVFNELPALEKLKRIGKMDKSVLEENKKPVIVIESEAGRILGLVMIENLDKEAGTMRLRWRKLLVER